MTTKIINLFGEPSAGKSTTAAHLFALMKHDGRDVELVTEFAKDITYEGHKNLLEDQLFLLANQHRRIARLAGQIEYIITDSPLLLNLLYTDESYFSSYKQLVKEIFYSYNNVNFLLKRSKPYNPKGRNQTEEEARELSVKLRKLLDENVFQYHDLQGNSSAARNILTIMKL
jgi:adenylate kinase family enzyme